MSVNPDTDRWAVVELDGGVLHVLPVCDAADHETDGCPCGPRVETDGGLIIIHNSFDGREAVEWANEILATND